MRNWVVRLVTVQKLDMRLHALEVRYRTIPVEKERLRKELEASAAKNAQMSANIRKLELAIKNDESSIAALEDKIKKIQIQSATTKKNSEYQALLGEISSAQGQISDLETAQLTRMEELDQAKKALAEAESVYKAALRTAKTEADELNAAAAQIKEEALKIKKERAQFAGLCDRTSLEAYTRLHEKDRSRQCLVPVKDGSCGHCALKLPPQCLNEAKKGQFTVCDNCGSILFDPDSPSDYQS